MRFSSCKQGQSASCPIVSKKGPADHQQFTDHRRGAAALAPTVSAGIFLQVTSPHATAVLTTPLLNNSPSITKAFGLLTYIISYI